MIPIIVLLLTCEGPEARRTKYAVRTVRALRERLQYTDDVLWHIADDGSGPDHRDAIEAALRDGPSAHHVANLSWSDSKGRGYGANMNAGRKYIDAVLGEDIDHLLIVEDDWELHRALDPIPYLRMFAELGDIGVARLSYIAYTAPLLGQFVATSDGHQWLRLVRDGPEGFVFSGHPRFEHRGFSRGFDWSEEAGLLPGDVELDAAFRYKQRAAGDRTEVVWPVDFAPAAASRQSYFGHIGAELSY